MRWRRNRELDMLAKRAFGPPTIPELIALTVALGAYAVMLQQPTATVPPVHFDRWLDCSQAHETRQCVARDFPKP